MIHPRPPMPAGRLGRVGLVALLVLVFGGVALAATAFSDSYQTARQRSDNGAPTWYRTALTGSDSTSSTTAISAQSVSGGDTFLKVNVRGTAPGATACVLVLTAGPGSTTYDTVAGVQTATFTTAFSGSSKYQPYAPLYFSLDGAASYDVRVIAVSSGTADLKAMTVGAASFSAE